MGSTAADPREELVALTRAFRQALVRHRRGGAWGVPGAPSLRAPGDGDLDGDAGGDAGLDAVPGARSLAAIRAELGDCRRCKLCSTRKNIVFGVGPEPAALMFIGEAPGADEDRLGDPFVGKAGELLDKMIEAMGWGRGDVYIANVLKCRPPGNRNPEADEVAACRPFLDAQILAVRPRIIVTLGRPAANTVLGRDAPISALRGQFHQHRGVRVMPTFHPAYLLREPARKRDTWSDLKQVIAELERLGVTPPRPPRG
jgi:DNA polymerase